MTSPARCYVEISRSRIAANYRAIQDTVGPAVQVMGVVKADAYGHGMLEVARILVGCGARWLAVSTVAEGVALREAGCPARILIMAGLLSADWAAAVAFSLTPVVHSTADIRSFEEAAESAGQPHFFHLKLDTGMARLGTRESPAEIARAVQACRFAVCEGVLSHFASAADFTSSQTDSQIARFVELSDALRELGVAPKYFHISSTNAIAYARPDAWRAIVRPGHALYGYVSPAQAPAQGPAPLKAIDVAPALSWKIKIVAVKDIPADTLVGYGGSARTRRETRIAILGAGYADGIPHRLSNRGRVIAAGKFAPIIGTVSMDLTTIDITDSPSLQPGDDVTLIGREGAVSQNAQEIARVAGTISYNVLCGIKPRVERVYVD